MDKKCRLVEQGFEPGSCSTYYNAGKDLACRVTLKWKGDTPYRLIHSYAHKAPECYLSIYQSGCNWRCLKCHSWRFSKYASGVWMSPKDIAKLALDYAEVNKDNIKKIKDFLSARKDILSYACTKNQENMQQAGMLMSFVVPVVLAF